VAVKGDHLFLGYGGKDIVKDVTLHLPQGKIGTIIGPNGCGKSTLLKGLSRTLPLRSGEVTVKGRPLKHRDGKNLARTLAFLPQSPHIPDQFSVRELVCYGRFPHTRWSGTLSKRDHRMIDWAMEQTGTAKYADRELIHLSGGERQRVWIALALAQEAAILLLDEPTTYLDMSHQFLTLELIKRLNREMGRTVLMVLHDLNQAARYSDILFVMDRGRLIARGSAEEILTEELLRSVFSLKTRIIRDEENGCPFVIPLTGLETRD